MGGRHSGDKGDIVDALHLLILASFTANVVSFASAATAILVSRRTIRDLAAAVSKWYEEAEYWRNTAMQYETFVRYYRERAGRPSGAIPRDNRAGRTPA